MEFPSEHVTDEFGQRYKLINKFGDGGGQSHTYLVKRDSDGQTFLLKWRKLQRSKKEEVVPNWNQKAANRFRYEVDALIALGKANIAHMPRYVGKIVGKHPVLPKIPDSSSWISGIIETYFHHDSLRNVLIADNAPIWESATAIAFMIQVLKTLQQCHRLEFTHRDIKPGNILVNGMMFHSLPIPDHI